MLNKAFSFLLIITIFFPSNLFADSKEKYFMVTAYYSPLPNQKYYSTWNYEDEIVLNWWWIVWSSWVKVFSWMLAWPKEYSFWTKVYLEWLWIWSIEDRWSAIISASSGSLVNDRLDVWVWYGDDWLSRAMFWWRRKVKWFIAPSYSDISLDLNNFPKSKLELLNKDESSDWSNSWVIDNDTSTWILDWLNTLSWWYLINNQEFSFDIVPTTSEQIKSLQDILTKLNYYTWAVDWDYNSIRKSIFTFQLSKDLVRKITDKWAWTFWPKTRESLKKEYISFLEKEKKLSMFKKLKWLSEEKTLEKIERIWTPRFWEVSSGVRELQNSLKLLWYFGYKDTAIFWEATKNSLISYQLDKKLINSQNDIWAWSFWEKTKEAIKKDLKKTIFDGFVEEYNSSFDKVTIFDKTQDI